MIISLGIFFIFKNFDLFYCKGGGGWVEGQKMFQNDKEML